MVSGSFGLPVIAVLTAVLVLGLLFADWRGLRVGVWIAKPLASAGFVTVGILAGALQSTFGLWILAALLLSWLGDVLLIPRGASRMFRGGALSFLLGHLAFTTAFALRGLEPRACVAAVLVTSIAAFLVLRWLGPRVPGAMRRLVNAYVLVISMMLVAAAGTAAHAGGGVLLCGAAMFYVSDLAVARDRFVAPGFVNRLWGLPLYYGAQLVLAWNAAA